MYRGASGHQYLSKRCHEHGSGNASLKSYSRYKLKSTLRCKACSVSLMHIAVKRVGRNHRRLSHWPMYLTSKTYWFPVPAISLQTFTSIVGGCSVAHTTDVVFAQWCSSIFQPGCTAVVRKALSRTLDRL
jgi:hypothetical protein